MDFKQLYDAHVAFVWRSLRRLGVNDADIQDAAQEVFVVVFRKLPEFEGRAKVTTWLFRICLRVAADRRKKAHVRREVLDDKAADQRDSSVDPSAPSERLDDLALFEMALRQMDIKHRAVFTLFELEGERCEDIAEALDLPIGTVYSRLRSARDSFRKAVRRASDTRQPRARADFQGKELQTQGARS